MIFKKSLRTNITKISKIFLKISKKTGPTCGNKAASVQHLYDYEQNKDKHSSGSLQDQGDDQLYVFLAFHRPSYHHLELSKFLRSSSLISLVALCDIKMKFKKIEN